MTRSILLVEDNPATRRMVKFVLEKHGYTLFEAPDGATALALMDAHQPALVLQDLVLPDIDGFTLVEKLRRCAGDRPLTILAFSGLITQLEEARISAVGFDDIISKPVEPSRLLAIVETHFPTVIPLAARFGHGRRILVVDDDPLQRKLTRARLMRLGFEITECADSLPAIESILARKPDAIVADVLTPDLEGLGLLTAIRQLPEHARLPVFLVTSSFLDETERDRAYQAGATAFVLRTPDLGELATSLRSYFLSDPPVDSVRTAPSMPADSEPRRRAVRQLERQVLHGSGLARRCSALSAELTVLAGISEVLLKHRDVDVALDEALTACFDAGGVSEGAIFLLDDHGSFRTRHLGVQSTWQQEDQQPFTGHEEELRAIISAENLAFLSTSAVPPREAAIALERNGSTSVLIVPLIHHGKPLGALMMVTSSSHHDELDWKIFAQGVGNQITQLLALTSAFAEREAIERDLLVSRAEWKALVEHAPDLIIKVNADGILEFSNHAMAGSTIAQLIGSPWLNQVRPEHRETARAAFQAVLATGAPANIEVSTGPEGQTCWYAMHMGPIRQSERNVGVVMIARDITEKKQAEAQAFATDRLASVGTLAAGVAHEINNPLAAVIANLDQLLLQQADPSSREPAHETTEKLLEARAGAERVRLIVRDLRTFSRPDEETLKPVNIEKVLESTLRLARNDIRHRAKLVVEYGPTPLVDGNESRLGQVFLNLLVNAAQAIPDAPGNEHEIRVKTWTDAAGRAVVSIADTGEGIDPTFRSRLFTPFATTKPIGVGTGLGLSICHRIISHLHGEILVESEPGKGTVFKIVLPATLRSHEEVKAPIPVSREASRRGKILVVDDEPSITHAIRRALATAHDVTEENHAPGALTRIDQGERYDVILCDLMMPQMTGMELFEAIDRIDAAQARRMIFLTGGAFTPWAQRFLARIDNQRIEKPFEIAALRQMVAELVR